MSSRIRPSRQRAPVGRPASIASLPFSPTAYCLSLRHSVRRAGSGLALLSLSLGFGVPALATEVAERLDPAAWRADLEQLVATLERVHPDFYARTTRARVEASTAVLHREIPYLEPAEIVTRMMAIGALAEDGHTLVEPTGPWGFDRWLPLRIYRFTDGLFVTAAAREHADLVGARVLALGGLDVESAWGRTADLMGADNAFDRLRRAPLLLGNVAVLEVIGALAPGEEPTIRIRRRDGSESTVAIPVVKEESFSLAWDGRPSDDFYDEEAYTPLHLRYRSAWWYGRQDDGLFYVQINFMGDSGRKNQSFGEFRSELWAAAETAPVGTFVLDLRYNIGGDGSLVNDFVHDLLRRPTIDRKGTLFVLVGRDTFSAGVMFARALEEHTEATFVGEPPGAYWESYGDATAFTLENSGLQVSVSTVYHQLSSYSEGRRLMPIELPAQFSSEDWLSGRDPALEAVRQSKGRPLLANVFREEGGKAGVEEYERRLEELGGIDWWEPFSLAELDSLGNELRESGRLGDALEAYELNARRHPDHWRVWYSLGRLHREAGRREEAIASYRRALKVDPFNNLASVQRQALAELAEEATE